jgi:hypothetical protein
MFTARQCMEGPDAGRWFAIVIEPAGARRCGYCGLDCKGHDSSDDALAHHLQYQLDRETDLWLERRSRPVGCEICAEPTTLRARLGRNTKLFVLCKRHQSTINLQTLFRRRLSLPTG